mgnify:CR=1 FL=1
MSHLQYSNISNLKNNNCGYRVIPKISNSKLPNGNIQNDNILGCNEDNKSKICPVLQCNNNQENNTKIYKRNFSNVKLEPIPGYRPEFSICRQYKNMNDIGDKHKTHKNTIIGKPEKENNLYPGKAPASEYFKYIDIESNLKSLNLPNSNCNNKKYSVDICDKIITDNPNLLDRPMCQNYKYSEFKEESEYFKYKNKCKDTKEKIRGFTCNEQVSDIRRKSQLKFNYEKRKDTPCNTGCLPPISHKLDMPQPLIYGNRHNMLEKPILQIGPERSDHVVENLWNNVSKRTYIYKKN